MERGAVRYSGTEDAGVIGQKPAGNCYSGYVATREQLDAEIGTCFEQTFERVQGSSTRVVYAEFERIRYSSSCLDVISPTRGSHFFVLTAFCFSLIGRSRVTVNYRYRMTRPAARPSQTLTFSARAISALRRSREKHGRKRKIDSVSGEGALGRTKKK